MKKISIFLLSFILSILLLAQLLVFKDDYSFNYLEFLKYEVVIIYILCVILSYKIYNRWEHPYIIIQGTFFLFLLSRVFLDLTNNWDLAISDKFRYYRLENEVLKKTLEILLEFIIFYFQGGVIYSFFMKKNKILTIDIETNLMKEKIGRCLLILGFLGSMLSKYKELIYIKKYGYLAIYKGELNFIEKNLFEKMGISLLIFGYILLIISGVSKKKFKIYSGIFLSVYLMDSLKGGRGNFLSMLLTIIILNSYLYEEKKLKVKNILFLGGFIVCFGYVINLFRSGYKVKEFNLYNIIINFLRDQGISVLVLSHVIDFKESFNNNGVPFLIAPIVDFWLELTQKEIYKLGQTVEYVKKFKGMPTQLSYFLNDKLYLGGQGVGGNFLAEFYEFLDMKDLGVIIFSFLLGVSIPYFFEKLKRTKLGIIFLFLNLGYIIYIPRSSLLRLDYNLMLRFYGLYFIYLFIEKILKNLKFNYLNDNKSR